MKLDNNIETIFKTIKEMNGNSGDIATRIITKKKNRVGYIFLESVSSDDKISNFLNKGTSFSGITSKPCPLLIK